jgi:hypothetical protein
MRKVLFGLAMMATLYIASCGKENSSSSSSDDITGKTTQQVFMMHAWKTTSFKDSSENGTIEAYDACSRDDSYQFTSATSYTWNDNSVKCDPSNPASAVGSWSMPDPAGKTVLINDIKFLGNTVAWTVEQMSGTTIVLRFRGIDNSGKDITWRLTLSK